MAKLSRRLGPKLTAILVVYLLVALVAVGMTLLMSWQLEGGAAAVNELGSQRMRSYRIALVLAPASPSAADQAAAAARARSEIAEFDRVLDYLQRGDSSRPMMLPRDQAIQARFAALRAEWSEQMKPRIEAVLGATSPEARHALLVAYVPRADAFVDHIDGIVRAIEQAISHTTYLLRTLQFGLIVLSLVGTVALIYLMFLLVVRPVAALEAGMKRMADGDFAVRLPVESQDEFGELASGFNSMAAHLQDLYANLEHRVAQKTRTLADKNEELATLYEVAALLGQPGSIEAVCRDFLRELMSRLEAQGGAVRLIEPDSGEIHLFVHQGLSGAFTESERCLRRGGCLCGEGAQRAQPSVHVLVQGALRAEPIRCREEGFATVGVFPMRLREHNLGLFNLYFREPREFSTQERFMLETLGRHLAIAVENQRLVAREKEMAISEERNLLAQELHDSIAQSLAFLNIQAQLLQDSLDHDRLDSAREELGRIREGIQESYDDVRELLVHFRTRMAETDIEAAIASALVRFESQTRVKTRFLQSGVGLPLAPEMQLQVMHIVQESLSNARKHAQATSVQVEMERGTVYRFWVRDDGRGFDPQAVHTDLHVGLRIMRERAHRIGGELRVTSSQGRGTEVLLTLPVLEAGRSAPARSGTSTLEDRTT
ncbi:MAG: type IV pili methyl-accepting chemotaxis transducer N-terminal domain-containing protein [Burkholderiales bacterium]|nr:type IV pili methyl-accepting chemotaxis transducer N-terminal domain-containing protein [Burkholderiales bacterium]